MPSGCPAVAYSFTRVFPSTPTRVTSLILPQPLWNWRTERAFRSGPACQVPALPALASACVRLSEPVSASLSWSPQEGRGCRMLTSLGGAPCETAPVLARCVRVLGATSDRSLGGLMQQK